jgi:importin subunit beta-1
MKHSDERVAMQAVEFWSTVCEEEIELAVELQEVRYVLSYIATQALIPP